MLILALNFIFPPPLNLVLVQSQKADKPGNTNRVGRLSTVDLLINVACFVKRENNIFNVKRS